MAFMRSPVRFRPGPPILPSHHFLLPLDLPFLRVTLEFTPRIDHAVLHEPHESRSWLHVSELGAGDRERLVLRFRPTERKHVREQHLNAGAAFTPIDQVSALF